MNRRRKPSRYSRYISNANKTLQTAHKALQVANQVKQLVNVEFKSYGAALSAATGYDTPFISNMSTIAQGDGPNDRDGNSVKLQSLDIRGWLTYYGGQSPCRIMVVQSTDGTNLSDITTLLDADLSNVYSLAFRDLNNTQNFKVLYDRVFDMDNIQMFDKSFNIHIDFKKTRPGVKKHITWTQADTAGTSFTGGQLYIVAISNITDAANACGFSYQSRIRYTDN